MREFYCVLSAITAMSGYSHLVNERYGCTTVCVLLTGFWLRRALVATEVL